MSMIKTPSRPGSRDATWGGALATGAWHVAPGLRAELEEDDDDDDLFGDDDIGGFDDADADDDDELDDDDEELDADDEFDAET
jgi:hypothetical protein